MTMKPAVDHEGFTFPVVRTFDPAKRYAYTWPGQLEKIVTGEELAALLKGADASMLNIKELAEGTVEPGMAKLVGFGGGGGGKTPE